MPLLNNVRRQITSLESVDLNLFSEQLTKNPQIMTKGEAMLILRKLFLYNYIEITILASVSESLNPIVCAMQRKSDKTSLMTSLCLQTFQQKACFVNQQ